MVYEFLFDLRFVEGQPDTEVGQRLWISDFLGRVDRDVAECLRTLCPDVVELLLVGQPPSERVDSGKSSCLIGLSQRDEQFCGR